MSTGTERKNKRRRCRRQLLDLPQQKLSKPSQVHLISPATLTVGGSSLMSVCVCVCVSHYGQLFPYRLIGGSQCLSNFFSSEIKEQQTKQIHSQAEGGELQVRVVELAELAKSSQK